MTYQILDTEDLMDLFCKTAVSSFATLILLSSCQPEKTTENAASALPDSKQVNQVFTDSEQKRLKQLNHTQFTPDFEIFGENQFLEDLTLLMKLSNHPELALAPEHALETYLLHHVTQFPAESWATLNTHFQNLLISRPELHRSVLQKLLEKQPIEAFSRIIDSEPTSETTSFATQLFLDISPKELSPWFSQNQGQLITSGQRDIIALAAARWHRDAHFYGPAYSWIEKSSTPKGHRKLRDSIWNVEKMRVQEKARQDPRKLAEEFAAGKSGHAPHWIRFLFQEWLASDAEAARHWFERYEGTLSQKLRSFTLMTFVRDAIKQNRFDEASQLINRIPSGPLADQVTKELNEARQKTVR